MNIKTLTGGIALLALSLAPNTNAQVGVQIRSVTPGAQAQTFEYISSFMTSDSKVVKGAPYSADTVNESVQVLADGNRIVHKSATKLYRDSEGRVRREQTLDALGPWAASEKAHQLIFISDPVAGVSYTLDPSNNSARKSAIFHLSGEKASFTVEARVAGEPGGMSHAEAAGGNVIFMRDVETKIAARRDGPGDKNVVKEQLGKRTFDGVEAEGTRTTFTIPAGQMGNERDMQTVTETWYSPELQMVVRSETKDPRMGTSTYSVININRSEQPRILFEIPSDYTLKEDSVKPRVMKKNDM